MNSVENMFIVAVAGVMVAHSETNCGIELEKARAAYAVYSDTCIVPVIRDGLRSYDTKVDGKCPDLRQKLTRARNEKNRCLSDSISRPT